MIKKFEEYIKESLWKSGINRAKNSMPRKEDEPNTNIRELYGVDLDLPFLVADSYLHIEGVINLRFYAEIEKHIKFIESFGWRIPTYEDLEILVNASEMNDIRVGHYSADILYIRNRYNNDDEITLPNTYQLGIWGYVDNKLFCLTSTKDCTLKINNLWKQGREKTNLMRFKLLLIKDKE